MSVLIECLTLVIPKKELEARYPGGTDAYLRAAMESEHPPRFACRGDAHLVNLSFYSPRHLRPCAALLEESGFRDVLGGRVLDFAYVDQNYGPTMPCDWLEWRQHRDGYSYAWLAGTAAGVLAAPQEWNARQSRAPNRIDSQEQA